MTGRWWPTKVRQFWRYVSGRVSPAERAALDGWLSPDQAALFDSMHRADRRHGLDVVAALRRDGHDDPDLLLAGLLHDSGKGRAVGLWARVLWSLGDRYGGWVKRAARRLPIAGPRLGQAFAALNDHAERSAELALEAGCSPPTADLIRHQARPADDGPGRALMLADEAN